MTRSGYAAIAGKPNAGKSTLMNALVGFKLSITNRKPQTTRTSIKGILTENDSQIIILDTPGVLDPKYPLQNIMMKEVYSSLEDADVIILVVDIHTYEADLLEVKPVLKKFSKPVLIALNKTDITARENVLKAISYISAEINAEVVPVSALKDHNLDKLKELIIKHLPESPFLYDPEEISDKPQKFFAAELIRETILELLHEELPYSIFVEIREYKEREKGKHFINADIIAERESQKGIILGRKGEMLKKIGERSRKKIESFIETGVYLQLFIKIEKNWRRNEKYLKSKLQ